MSATRSRRSGAAGRIHVIIPAVIAALIFAAALFFLESDPGGSDFADYNDYESVSELETRDDADRDDSDDAPLTEDPEGTTEVADSGVEGPTRGVEGLVRDAVSLEPLADAHVELLRLSMNWAGGDQGTVTSTTTDSEGRFRLEVPGGLNQIAVGARCDGYVAIQRLYWNGIETPRLQPFDLVSGIRVSGQVVTEDGSPVGGGKVYSSANLSLQRNPGWGTSSTVAVMYLGTQFGPSPSFPVDERGRFSVFLNGDLVALQASVPGYGPAYSDPFELGREGKTDVQIVVSKGRTFRGIVKSKSGEPVAGARVTVAAFVRDVMPDRQFRRYLSGGSAVSGADGTFDIPDMPDEVGNITVEHEGYLAHQNWQARMRSDAPERHVIELEPGQWISGRAVDENDKPLTAGRGSLRTEQQHLGQVDFLADGTFKSDPFTLDVAGGTLTAPGAGDQDVAWEAGPGEHDVGRVQFASGKVITVGVRDARGDPLPGATVRTGARRNSNPWGSGGRGVETDASGEARLAGLGAGATSVVVELTGYSGIQESVHLAADQESHRIDVTLSRAARVLLTVVDNAGEPLSGVIGEARPKSAPPQNNWWGPVSAIQSDPEGRIAFSDLDIDTDYVLTLDRTGFPTKDIEVEPLGAGESRDLGVTALDAGTTISGRVTDSGGRGIADALVSANVMGGRGPGRRARPSTASTDGDGRYTLTGIADGTVNVSVTAEGYVQAQGQSVTVENGNPVRDILFKLRPGEVYEGIVTREDGTPVAGVTLYINGKSGGGWKHTSSDAEGKFKFVGAPDGEVNLNVNLWSQGSSNYSEQFEAASVRGLPTEIVIPTGATLEVTVKVTGGRELPKSVAYSMARTGNNRGRQFFMNGQNRITLEDGKGVVEGVQAGEYQFSITAEGFPATDPQELVLTSGQRQKVEFLLDGQAVGVTILVEDAENKPIAKASVNVAVASGQSEMQSNIVYSSNGMIRTGGGSHHTTNTEGTCVTYALTGDPATVNVSAAGYAPTSIQDAHTQVAGDGLTVVLQKESAFLVTVTGEDGTPLDGVSVSARKAGSGDSNPNRMRGMVSSPMGGFRMGGGLATANGGFVRIGGLAADDYDLHFSRSGEELGVVETRLDVGEEQPVEFQLSPALLVRGTVTINGVPADGSQLRLTRSSSRKEVTVGGAGQYETELASGGKYVAAIRTDGTWLKGQPVEIHGSGVVDLEFGAARVQGLILMPDGSPAVNLRGNLSGGGGWVGFRTDEEGRFDTEVSPGTYSWHIQPPEDTFAPQTSIEIQDNTEVTYQLGGGTTLRIRFVGDHIPGNVWVTHVDANDNRTVTRIKKGNPRSEDGIEVTWPVEATVGYVQGNDAARAYFELEPGQTELEMAMESGGSLSVRVLDDNQNAVPGALVSLEAVGGGARDDVIDPEKTGANGNVWLAVPPGEYRVVAKLPSGEELDSNVTVKAGQAASTMLEATGEVAGSADDTEPTEDDEG